MNKQIYDPDDEDNPDHEKFKKYFEHRKERLRKASTEGKIFHYILNLVDWEKLESYKEKLKADKKIDEEEKKAKKEKEKKEREALGLDPEDDEAEEKKEEDEEEKELTEIEKSIKE